MSSSCHLPLREAANWQIIRNINARLVFLFPQAKKQDCSDLTVFPFYFFYSAELEREKLKVSLPFSCFGTGVLEQLNFFIPNIISACRHGKHSNCGEGNRHHHHGQCFFLKKIDNISVARAFSFRPRHFPYDSYDEKHSVQ